MGIHTPEQLREKAEAIDIATDAFVTVYHDGHFENNKAYLYHSIENLYSLLVELQRG